MPIRRFLHAGCGPENKAGIEKGFNASDWQEVRLDIDPDAKPDIVATMTDMSGVATGSMDAVVAPAGQAASPVDPAVRAVPSTRRLPLSR